MPLKIVYDTITCTTALDNAGIFNGENEGYGWGSHGKQNISATVSGPPNKYANNATFQNLNMIFDNDYIDTYINDQDLTWGEI
ncbi:hypothetical protein [Scopulibacillus cellulosilyticus]|uniref:Spore germination protein GerPA/GerPF n=1 Tax=Scopulibacillus cellulosilyticus TaxID=2665665 RepID=A0ABW2Q3U7_9BACL